MLKKTPTFWRPQISDNRYLFKQFFGKNSLSKIKNDDVKGTKIILYKYVIVAKRRHSSTVFNFGNKEIA